MRAKMGRREFIARASVAAAALQVSTSEGGQVRGPRSLP
jgi:hypothetical protein